jgi:hypothetical protein
MDDESSLMHQNEYESDHSITKTNLGLSRSSIGNVTGEIFYYQAEIFYYYALSISHCKSSGEDLQTYCDNGTLSFGKSLSYFCINRSLSPHAFSLNIVCHTLCLSFTPSSLPHLTSSHTHTLRIILELWDPSLRCVFRLYLIIWISWKKRLVHTSMPALQLIHFTR